MKNKRNAALLLLLTLFSGAAEAETRYISDVLYVPLRSGQSAEHRVVHTGLKSGVAVEVLDQSEDGGWFSVKTNEGAEGWIQARYLVKQPVARQRIQEVNRQLEGLKVSGGSQVKKLLDLQEKTKQLQLDKSSLEKSNSALSGELSHIKKISVNTIRIDKANHELIKKNQLMEVIMLGDYN